MDKEELLSQAYYFIEDLVKNTWGHNDLCDCARCRWLAEATNIGRDYGPPSAIEIGMKEAENGTGNAA